MVLIYEFLMYTNSMSKNIICNNLIFNNYLLPHEFYSNHLLAHKTYVLLGARGTHASSNFIIWGLREGFTTMSFTISLNTLVTITICHPLAHNCVRFLQLPNVFDDPLTPTIPSPITFPLCMG
jgi:hypothetical protein